MRAKLKKLAANAARNALQVVNQASIAGRFLGDQPLATMLFKVQGLAA